MSYGGDPENNKIDAVRTILSDDSDDDGLEMLTDAQINFFLAAAGQNVWMAAKRACMKLAAAAGRKVRHRFNELQDEPDRNAKFWMDMAAELDAIAMEGAVSFFWGGLSKVSKVSFNQDTDNEDAAFSRATNNAQLLQTGVRKVMPS